MRFAWLPRGAALVALLGAGPLHADVWDVTVDNDNGMATDNVPTHGVEQLHDLGALPGPTEDEDWFSLCTDLLRSYEVVVDGLTGDISENGNLLVDRVDLNGSVVQSATLDDFADQNLVLRWLAFAGCGTEFIRVSTPGCGTACDANDRYRIRYYDTTVAVPRYNNANGQVTFLIIQNPTGHSRDGIAYLWSTAGNVLTQFNFVLAPHAALVTNLATVNGGVANGTSGTITIQNTAGYGELAAKAVALEPSTGYSFDSPGLYRPH